MAETFRLVERAAASLVDRAPVDWTALRARVRQSRERDLIDNLRVIAAMYRSDRPPARASIAAAIVAACGAVEMAAFLGLAAAAGIQGGFGEVRTAQLVLAIAFAAPCIWLALAAGRDARSLFLVAIFACAASAFARSAARHPLPPLHQAFPRVYIEAFLPACAWQFALDFPEVLRFARFDRLARYCAAVAWILGTVLFLFNTALGQPLVHLTRAQFLLHDDPRHWFWHVLSLTLAPALAAILIRARRAPDRERHRVVRLATAIAVGLSPFLVLALARIFVPAVDVWFRSDAAAGREAIYIVVVAGLAAMPVLSAAAVFLDRPFPIQPAGALLPIMRVRRLHLPRAMKRRLSLAIARPRVVSAIDRVAAAHGLPEKSAVLASELAWAIAAPRVRVLTATPAGAFVDSARPSLRLAADSALVAVLREAADPVDVSPPSALCGLLPSGDVTWIADNDVRLVAPIRRRGGLLLGLLAVGGRTDEERFTRGERDLVAVFSAVAGATWPEPHEAGSAEFDDEPALECGACGMVGASTARNCACGADAIVAALPSILAAKFVVERRIGAGGSGTVYLAHDRHLDRPVALKTLARVRGRAFDRLVREARAMASLNHDGVATLYGLERWREMPVLVVEYLSRGTLAQRLAAGRLSTAEAIDLGLRLARALVYMHERGVLHCDLKPSNIGFTEAGDAKVLDFGLATFVGIRTDSESDADVARRGGTPAYLPPEAIDRAPHASDDLWALAVVIAESITGRHPLATLHAGLACAPHDVAASLSGIDVPPALRTFLRRALSASPGERFQTAREMRDELERMRG